MRKYLTDFLFIRPTFVRGMASVSDLSGALVEFNDSDTPEEADLKALKCDWAIAGNDIDEVLSKQNLIDEITSLKD